VQEDSAVVYSELVKGKVIPVLNQLGMKICGGGGSITPPFLTSALDGGESSGSCPGCFVPGERALGTHWIGGWVGPRAGLDTVC
jgi:hypothetical protein